MERDLSQLRQEYAAGGLSEADLEADPVAMFRRWLHDAVTSGLHEPNAMVLATVDGAGRPSTRMVLLKGIDDSGFAFFTNYGSRKGIELRNHAACALLFPWHVVERQVRIEGEATRMSAAENAAYFATRPRASQLGAWASPQSEVISSRTALDAKYDEIAAQFGEGDIPVPPHWGGFRVRPETVEFWQGRRGRLHDRLRYRRTPGGWVTERLAP